MKFKKPMWCGAWRSETWASTRGVWKRLTPEEEEQDAHVWREASSERGTFAWVFWCEVRQLAGDILPEDVREELRKWSGDSRPKSPEGR